MTARNYASMDFPELMNALVGSLVHYKDDGICANIYASTTGLEVLDALNRKLGTRGLDLPDVLSRLAGFSRTVDVNVALARLVGITTGTSVNAGLASGTGTAFNPSITITGGTLSVNAGNAAGTGTAFNAAPLATGSVQAGLASGTGTAYNPSISIAQPAGVATGTGSAKDATVSSGTWTPASLPSLQALYQSDNAGSITGSPVTQWNDLSGNARHVTILTGMTSPTTGSRTINGRNAIGFNGTTMDIGATGFTAVAGNAHSFGAIFLSDGVGSGYDRILSLQDSTVAGNVGDFDIVSSIAAILRDNTSAAWNAYYNGTPRSTKAATDTAAHLIIIQRNGDTLDIYVDGSAGTQATGLGTGAFHIDRLCIGNAWSNGSPNHLGVAFFKGAIGVVAWSNAVWSSGDRASFLAYSQATWGTP